MLELEVGMSQVKILKINELYDIDNEEYKMLLAHIQSDTHLITELVKYYPNEVEVLVDGFVAALNMEGKTLGMQEHQCVKLQHYKSRVIVSKQEPDLYETLRSDWRIIMVEHYKQGQIPEILQKRENCGCGFYTTAMEFDEVSAKEIHARWMSLVYSLCQLENELDEEVTKVNQADLMMKVYMIDKGVTFKQNHTEMLNEYQALIENFEETYWKPEYEAMLKALEDPKELQVRAQAWEINQDVAKAAGECFPPIKDEPELYKDKIFAAQDGVMLTNHRMACYNAIVCDCRLPSTPEPLIRGLTKMPPILKAYNLSHEASPDANVQSKKSRSKVASSGSAPATKLRRSVRLPKVVPLSNKTVPEP